MTYLALRVAAALVGALPRSASAYLGAAIGWVAGSLLRIRRGTVEAAMRRARVPEPSRVAGLMYRDLGRGVAELLWLAGTSPSRRRDAIESVEIDSAALSALDRALASGPVILFASHTGNWELAAAAAARILEERGRRLVVVAKAIHERGVDRFVASLRRALGVHVVPPRGALVAASRALASGDVVVMPIDQVPDRTAHAIQLPFLGAEALVDRAPATLAWRANATILVAAAERAHHRHALRVLDVVEPRARRREFVAEATAKATANLEAFVRASPASWLWLHRRWRAPRESAAAIDQAAGSRLVASAKAS